MCFFNHLHAFVMCNIFHVNASKNWPFALVYSSIIKVVSEFVNSFPIGKIFSIALALISILLDSFIKVGL